MSTGGRGFLHRLTPWGGGGEGAAVITVMARAGVEITPKDASNDQGADAEGSPLRTRWSMISPTTTTGGNNTPAAMQSVSRNTKPVGPQFSTRITQPL